MLVNLQDYGLMKKPKLDYEYTREIPNYFAVSKYCNIRCDYCYVPELHKNQQEGVDQRALTMTDEMVKKARAEKFALKYTCLHGAEPTTLSPPVLKEVVDKLATITVSPLIGMQTNGVALNKHFYRKMGEMQDKLYIGFTLDLPKVLHDKNRQRTYNKVRENMRVTRDLGYSYKLLVGVTREVLDHLPAFERELREILKEHPILRVALKHIKGPTYDMNEEEQMRWADFLWRTGFYDFDHTVWGKICHTQGNDCHWFEFCDDGAVTACNKNYNDHSSFANWLTEPMDEVLNKRRMLFKDREVSTQCNTCMYWKICKGGCPVDRGVNNEAHDCTVRRRLFWHMIRNDKLPAAEIRELPRQTHRKTFVKWVKEGVQAGFIPSQPVSNYANHSE